MGTVGRVPSLSGENSRCLSLFAPGAAADLPRMEEHTLNRGEAMRIGWLSPCTELEGRDGVIWVTFAGDLVDYLVSPGERLRVDGRRGIVVSALGSSSFSLSRNRACLEPAPLLRVAST